MNETIVNIPRSSLSSGSALYSVLKDLLGEGHVRPVVSENEVTLPLVTFRRIDVRSLDDKGRSGYDEVCYEVVVFATTYGESVETMERVRKQLVGRIIASEEEDDFAMTMDCVKVVGGEESWKDGAFVQTIRLSYHVALGLVKQKMGYEYTLSAAKWGTIIIPFSCAKPDGLKLYEALSLDENGKIVMKEVDRFEANTPYIVGGTPGQYRLEGYAGKHGDKYTKGILTGVYVLTNPPVGSFILQNHPDEAGVAFYRVPENVKVWTDPNRCYIEPQEGAGGSASMPGGGSSQPAPAKPKRTLTVRSANDSQGTVSGGGTFDDGSTRTVQATPQAGFAFDKWSDGNMENPRTVKLASDLTLTASFKVDTTGGGDQGGGTLGD
jgi:hypothetical protein